MKYYKNDKGTVFEFTDSTLILQPDEKIPLKLPKGKKSIFRSQEKLEQIEIELPDLQVPKKPRNAEYVREELLAELKLKRKEAENAGVSVNGQLWGSTLKDEIRLNSALKFFEETGVKEISGWQVSKDLTVNLTPDLARNVLSNLMTHYEKAFSVEAKKAKELNSLKTVKSLNAYKEQGKLDTGWS